MAAVHTVIGNACETMKIRVAGYTNVWPQVEFSISWDATELSNNDLA
jgi:hypothetical protein